MIDIFRQERTTEGAGLLRSPVQHSGEQQNSYQEEKERDYMQMASSIFNCILQWIHEID